MRISCCMLAGLLMAVWISGANAQLPDPHAPSIKLDISSQPLGDALNEFAKQAGLQVVLYSKISEGLMSPPIVGKLSPQSALTRLLDKTGLRFEYIDAVTVGIFAEGAKTDLSTPQTTGMRVVQADAAAEVNTTADAQESPQTKISGVAQKPVGADIEEIVVTAQKRVERLQDVPVPVTVLGAESLVNSNQLRLQDYYTKVPGLNLTTLGNVGSPSISIRGLTTGGLTNPTVGVVVDDLPFGGSSSAVNLLLTLAPDFEPSELSRIEVLRGPQGTLYGASSLGGLLKFVTVDPSTDRTSGHFQVGTSSVDHSDDLGYSLRGAVNLPVSDTFAVRVSGSLRRDAGYVDNVQTGQDDLNRADARSTRLAAVWRPNDNFSLKLSALYQQTERDGIADTQQPGTTGPLAGLKELEQSTLIDSGRSDQKFQAYSATMTWKLDRAELTSLSGYNIGSILSTVDETANLGFAAQALVGAPGLINQNDPEVSKFTQELRLATPLSERVDWLLGAFYTHENYDVPGEYYGVNTSTGAVVGNVLLLTDQSGSYTEYAAFTNLTFQINDRWDVQVGARQSRNSISYEDSIAGPLYTFFGLPSPSITPKSESKDTAFTYLLTPRFKISPDLMVYARLASGYRPGGPITNPFARAAGLTEFEHDTTQNYEVGFKGNALNAMVSFDASLYRINWKDMQLSVRDTVNTTIISTANAGKAKSEGVELSVDLKPLEGLTISAWTAYNVAEMTDVPANITLAARPGDRLPYSARWSGYFSVDQEFPLWGGADGFVGASMSYVGDRKGIFFTSGVQETFPSYAVGNLNAGVRLNTWTANVYLNNVADKRGVLRGGRDSSYPGLITYIQPRTGGVSLTKEF